MVLIFDDKSSLLSKLMIVIQLFSLLVSLPMHIYIKILVCDWLSAHLLVKESVHDHRGVQLQHPILASCNWIVMAFTYQ